MTNEEFKAIQERVEIDEHYASWGTEGYPQELKDRRVLVEEVARLRERETAYEQVLKMVDESPVWQDSLDKS